MPRNGIGDLEGGIGGIGRESAKVGRAELVTLFAGCCLALPASAGDVIRIAGEIQLDGLLDDDAWQVVKYRHESSESRSQRAGGVAGGWRRIGRSSRQI
jgi:hypothetical protein